MPKPYSNEFIAPSAPLKPDRWEMFCQHYIIHFNGSKAAVEAGFSEKSKAAQAQQLLRNKAIRSRIEYLKKERLDKLEVTQMDAVRELVIMLRSNIDNYEVKDGKLKVKDHVPESAMRAVASLKLKEKEYVTGTTERELEIRLWPKDRIVELVMKHLGMLKERIQIDDPEDVLAQFLQIKKEQLPS